MKCLILGFDGLEYEFVEKFDLKNLKQEEYGKVRIPKECFVEVTSPHFKETHFEPWTPLIWSSFLTGKLPGHGIRYEWKWDNKALYMLEDLSVKLGLGKLKGRRFLKILGFKKRLPDKRDYSVPTIFDLVKRNVDIDVPVYSEGWSLSVGVNPDSCKNFDEFITLALKKQLSRFDRNRAITLDILKKDVDLDLLMMYARLLDTYGELCFSDAKKLHEIYLYVDSFVKEVKSLLDESLVLIISDHGIEKLEGTRFGKHSNYAFYSTNRSLGLKNPQIIDFYNIIQKAVQP